MNVYLPDLAATEDLGHGLVRSSPGGGKIALVGDLGVGKTSLVRACLRAMGEEGSIRSPTFTLLETYTPGAYSVHHLDLYRLGPDDDLSDLGLRELGPKAWCFVEWPDRVPLDLKFDLRICIDLKLPGRKATLSSNTDMGAKWLEKLYSN